ncbi:hypothetical protein GF357_02840 [Candidatus Dojkabacteria bacterium]|nr:hypothetical protein [Candidatus Dojkabacteria bacterium]
MRLEDYKYKVDYKWLKTKDDSKKEFDLISPAGRRLYFNSKIGKELSALREYLKNNTFIGYLLAPKMAGKGTYSKMLREIVGPEYFEIVSVGDAVRAAHKEFLEQGKNSDLYAYAKENYRGMMGLDEAFDSLVNRTQKGLMPTEFILTIVKREIDRIGHKSIFIDGFPRKVDQVSYSLYFRDLINYRGDPDLFVLISLPLEVIDARIRGRRVCPKCKTPTNIRLLPTSIVRFDEETQDYYLVCDNPNCEPTRLVEKEGDDKGIELIRERLENDLELVNMARNMYGISRIELFNSLEVDVGYKYVDDYEITKEYSYEGRGDDIVTVPKPFEIEDHGVKYFSLLPPPVVVQFVRQLVDVFNLT